uniref:Flavodoxin family protein n=1 Tax=Ignisphaera aggregans TaxID=334771 RepID=A0A7J3QF32_9CREN
MANIIIIYYSSTGHTEKLARAVYEGAVSIEGVNVALKRVENTKVDELLDADAIVFGSPSYFRLPSWQLKKFIDESIDVYERLEGKIGGAICTAGSRIGAEKCLQALKDVIEEHGMIFIEDGVWAIEDPDDDSLRKAREYGRKIALKILKK